MELTMVILGVGDKEVYLAARRVIKAFAIEITK